MEPVIKKLTSRKFLSALIVSVTIFLNSYGVTNLETAELFALSATATAFIVGESILDRERIRAERLVAIQNAEAQFNSAVNQANAMLQEKEELITNLQDIVNNSTPNLEAVPDPEDSDHPST